MIKLPNSQDPAVLAENIVHLRDGIAAVDAKTLPATTSATTGQILGLTGENKTPAWVDASGGLPDTSEATTGQILGLTGENKTPAWVDGSVSLPDYSTTETATGQKWIDGKEIFQKVVVYDMSDKEIQNGTATTTSTGVSDADFIFVDKFIFVDPNTNGIYTSPLVGNYNTYPFIDYDDKTKIRFKSNTTWNSHQDRIVYIVLKYTKATPTRKTTKNKTTK